ncbi:MAG: hexose kinase [Tissierellia bacterium]|nr:hexose kinase [Tissierellia bacterium]
MIITITANPSIDMSYILDELKEDDINRTDKVNKTAGGKGLNVSKVLTLLGADVLAMGFLGGKNGEFIEDELKERGIKSNFVKIKEASRNCIALLYDDNQTEILEAGPNISEDEQKEIFKKLEEIEIPEFVCMSGGLARGLDKGFYADIVEIVNKMGSKAVVDTSGDSLKEIFKRDELPYMLKPNLEELEALLGKSIGKDTNRMVAILKEGKLAELPNILVSLGSDGAIARFGDKLYRAYLPKVKVVSPVGSGDSTVAGFVYASSKGKDDIDILKTAMACGVLNAMQMETGYIDIKDFDDIFNKIEVEII